MEEKRHGERSGAVVQGTGVCANNSLGICRISVEHDQADRRWISAGRFRFHALFHGIVPGSSISVFRIDRRCRPEFHSGKNSRIRIDDRSCLCDKRLYPVWIFGRNPLLIFDYRLDGLKRWDDAGRYRGDTYGNGGKNHLCAGFCHGGNDIGGVVAGQHGFGGCSERGGSGGCRNIGRWVYRIADVYARRCGCGGGDDPFCAASALAWTAGASSSGRRRSRAPPKGKESL